MLRPPKRGPRSQSATRSLGTGHEGRGVARLCFAGHWTNWTTARKSMIAAQGAHGRNYRLC